MDKIRFIQKLPTGYIARVDLTFDEKGKLTGVRDVNEKWYETAMDPICTWVEKEELEGVMQFYMDSYLKNCAVGPELFEEKPPESKQTSDHG